MSDRRKSGPAPRPRNLDDQVLDLPLTRGSMNDVLAAVGASMAAYAESIQSRGDRIGGGPPWPDAGGLVEDARAALRLAVAVDRMLTALSDAGVGEIPDTGERMHLDRFKASDLLEKGTHLRQTHDDPIMAGSREERSHGWMNDRHRGHHAGENESFSEASDD